MKRFLLVGILTIVIGVTHNVQAQVSIKDSAVFTPIIDFAYSYRFPGNDLAKRFGDHSEIGLSFFIKDKKNFLYGIEWNYLFGGEVKELGFADAFRDVNGGILANNGLYSEVYFVERGFTMSARFGKIFNMLAVNPNSGVMFIVGAGFMQHRIKIEDKFQEVPLLSDDGYYQGYDRLSNGLLLTQFLGYRLLSDRRLVNVFGGIEFAQAFTQNRRAYNFDTGIKDDSQRLDTSWGIKLGFSLPLYKPTPKEYYYR